MISNEREHLLVIHEVLLPETTGHQQQVQLRRLRDSHLRSQYQTFHVSNRIPCFRNHAHSGIRMRASTSKGRVKSIWSIRGKITQPMVRCLVWHAGFCRSEIVEW